MSTKAEKEKDKQSRDGRKETKPGKGGKVQVDGTSHHDDMLEEDPAAEGEAVQEAQAGADAGKGKDGYVKKPDKQVFERKVAEVQTRIDEFQGQMAIIQKKADEHRGKKGAKGPMGDARQKMRELRNKKDKIMERRKALFNQRDKFRSAMDAMKEQMAQMRGELKFTKADQIDNKLKELQRKQSTTSMTLNQEKDLIKEIETLISCRKVLSKLKVEQDKISAQKEESGSLGDQIGAVNEELKGVNGEIDAQKAVLDKLNEAEGGKKDIFPQLMAEKDEIKKKVDEEYNQIRELRKEWREENNKWYEYSKILRAQRQKEWEEEQARRQVEWEEQEKIREAEEAKKDPFEGEKLLCDNLVKYLTETFIDDGKKKSEESKASIAHLDGMVPLKKGVGEDIDVEDWMAGSGGKKKGGKKKGKKGGSKKKITHSIDTMQTFALIELTPPQTAGEVEESIKNIKAKKEFYMTAPRPEKKKKGEDGDGKRGPKKSSQKLGDIDSTELFPTLGGGAAPAKKAAPPPAAPKTKAAPAAAAAAADDDDDDEVDLSSLKSAPGVNCSGKEIEAKHITYDDDNFLGKKLPDLDSLEWFQGADEAKASLCSPNIKVVIFWAKFAKGDWKATIHHFEELSNKFPKVEFLGISCDPKKEEAEKILKKANGEDYGELNMTNFRYTFPAAYDPDRKVNKKFMKVGGLSSMGAGYAFIIDKFQTIVWKEFINMNHELSACQFTDQLTILQEKGEGRKHLIKNGDRPEDPDEEEEITADVGGDEFDAFADDAGGEY